MNPSNDSGPVALHVTTRIPPDDAAIACPKCGYGEGLRYLEDIVCYRKVVGLRRTAEGATLVINGFYETGEGYDDGIRPRLECRQCFHEFPIPAGVHLDFV